jgi:hypothetical protein
LIAHNAETRCALGIFLIAHNGPFRARMNANKRKSFLVAFKRYTGCIGVHERSFAAKLV